MLSHALCIVSVVLSEVPNLAGVCRSGGFVGERRADESPPGRKPRDPRKQ